MTERTLPFVIAIALAAAIAEAERAAGERGLGTIGRLVTRCPIPLARRACLDSGTEL